MADELRAAFRSYTDAVRVAMQSQRVQTRTEMRQGLSASERRSLQALVEGLEESESFFRLLRATLAAFPDYFGSAHRDQLDAAKRMIDCVMNFFRRSRYYIDVFEGNGFNVDDLFEEYKHSFQRGNIDNTYLALLNIGFSNTFIDFKEFHIQWLLPNELDIIVRNDVNAVFYPESTIDTRSLIGSYIIWRTSVRLDTSEISLDQIMKKVTQTAERIRRGEVLRGFEPTNLPGPIEEAVKYLVLYHWNSGTFRRSAKSRDDLAQGWDRFHIHFSMCIPNHLLDFPSYAPDLSPLDEWDLFTLPDPQTGGVIGQGPIQVLELNEEETEHFERFVRHIRELCQILRPKAHDWRFLELAHDYLTKAFLTADISELLWHTIALEALLVKKDERVAENLARRIALILQSTERERETIRKQFREIYDFRCDLVHGREFERQVYEGHLRMAREFARRTLLWFLHYLSHVQTHLPPSQAVPTREELLDRLDLSERFHLGNVPLGFPNVPEWIPWME